MAIELKDLMEKAENKLSGVHPFIAAKARQIVQTAFKEGINVLITQGLRTIQEQNELYAQGRTKPGKVVTNAKGGYSYHNFGLAVDFVIQNADGSLNWNVDANWKRVAAIGKSLGLEWGGDWDSFKDYPHFQFTFGLSLADLRAGKKPTATEDTPYKVIIPNTAYWQAKALVSEFEKRGFKCEGVAKKTYGSGVKPGEKDPYQFVIKTNLEQAKQLVIELKTRGYDRAFGEEIK